ncbi:MAG: hypothetical protein Q9222_003837 [Ikaeria aurantiellina]
MVDFANAKDAINPITALAFVPVTGKLFLLAGEGPHLSFFNNETAQLLAAERVFKAQAIHGISTAAAIERNRALVIINVLIWGGRSVRFAEIWLDPTTDDEIAKIFLRVEVALDDWILSASLKPTFGLIGDAPSQRFYAVLVTAHNVALELSADAEDESTVRQIAAGPSSMLYSACIECTEEDRVLIAAGTVFGEVLLWSFSQSAFSGDAGLPAACLLHYRFTGHEGSVFDVRISPPISGLGYKDGQRLIASCSDDRTIRLWDVRDLQTATMPTDMEGSLHGPLIPPLLDGTPEASSDQCTGTVMGHVSRIWDVHFLVSPQQMNLLSLGEDGTAQTWQVNQESFDGILGLSEARAYNSLQVSHRKIYAYHVGKNIWAGAVHGRPDGTFVVATGGADGRVASYIVYPRGTMADDNDSISKWTIQDVAMQLEDIDGPSVDGPSPSSQSDSLPLSRLIFDALNGAWVIKREITSSLPTYPSGAFRGEVTFERRPPTASEIDEEYLYIESGTFSTHQGFSFNATRRYVYRYQASSDRMSAWFVKPDDSTTVDYLFHEIQSEKNSLVRQRDNLEGQAVIHASSYHLCVEDHYTPDYEFYLQDGNMHQWRLKYQVKGPQKDYVADASYMRKNDCNDRKLNDREVYELAPAPKEELARISLSAGQKLGEDSFKAYAFIDQHSFLVTTAQGRVLIGRLKSLEHESGKDTQDEASGSTIRWETLDQLEALKSSTLVTKAVSSGLVLLSGSDGTVFYYDPQRRQIRSCLKLPRKAAFLHFQYVQHVQAAQTHEDLKSYFLLATCLGISTAYVYQLLDIDLDTSKKDPPLPILQLALPRPFVVTSACYIEETGIWVLGSRGGAIACYIVAKSPIDKAMEPCSIVEKLHGDETITVIQKLPQQDSSQATILLTSGRDGHYAVHEMSIVKNEEDQCHVDFQTVHRAMPPFGPNIEGAAIEQKTHDLLLWGFRSKEFVVYNATNDIETMTVDCGGAHRNWCYQPRSDGSDGGTFVWTKASVCYVHLQSRASHRVLKSGSHGREIKAMAISAPLKDIHGVGKSYFATGAEDTTIRIWSYPDSSEPETAFRCLTTLKKHTTGVQQLKWSDDGDFLFSAAGCEEFFVWRVQEVPFIGIGAVCATVFPRVTEDGDLRIMDVAITPDTQVLSRIDGSKEEKRFVISLVFSDSSIRVCDLSSSNANG